MKKKQAALIFASGILLGSMVTPAISSANSNVILASVEWVNSQLNPLKTKVNSLEAEVAALRQAVSNGGGAAVPALPSSVNVKSVIADVHSGALKQYRILKSFPAGSSLKVVQEHTNAEGKWYRVEISSGTFGWIQAGEVTTAAVAPFTTFSVKTTGAVRSGATADYRQVGTASAGQNLKYITAFKNNKNEVWYNIELANGTRGWIEAKHGEVK
ncbi:SH3 domain-containing protein [Bacillus lacus]|uniref:SH3 domain-containing protein n=1 Tax=Metabacillus lacus TaxID=1983721 RepID=A0A7X2LZP5_9BACI|nr:SH3 domain-containing protein [Metabacillus lacus]MRX72172.1 SH3 domain-containing protein [Metabacillus lacus]